MSASQSRGERRRNQRALAKKSDGPSCPLLIEMAPLTLAHMVPGYQYEPGMTLVQICTLPVFGSEGDLGVGYQFPVKLPPQYSTATPFNIALALALLKRTDPEAAAMIASLEDMARTPRSRQLAKQHPSFRLS